jgi:hypothetical protein
MMQKCNTILYINYGFGLHTYEALFSILTLERYQLKRATGAQICVLTDAPQIFLDHGVEPLHVPRTTFDEWKGPHNLGHRCKIYAIRHALDQFGGRCLYVDGDTYFIRTPTQVLDRIGPGRSVMHRIEGQLGQSRHEGHRRVGEILKSTAAVGGLARGPRSFQWNAGVVGIHASDIHLLDEVLGLTDSMLDEFYSPVMEQVAFSLILAERTRLRSARDTIYHYCVSPDRQRFRTQLPKLLASTQGMSLTRRADWLYAHRTQPTWNIRIRGLTKDLLNAAGILPVRDRFDCT